MVKRIYREYLEEASLLQIERGLETDGILTGAGKTKWRPETLKKILQCSRLPTPERGIWRVRKKLPIGIDGFSNNISNTEDGGWK